MTSIRKLFGYIVLIIVVNATNADNTVDVEHNGADNSVEITQSGADQSVTVLAGDDDGDTGNSAVVEQHNANNALDISQRNDFATTLTIQTGGGNDATVDQGRLDDATLTQSGDGNSADINQNQDTETIGENIAIVDQSGMSNSALVVQDEFNRATIRQIGNGNVASFNQFGRPGSSAARTNSGLIEQVGSFNQSTVQHNNLRSNGSTAIMFITGNSNQAFSLHSASNTTSHVGQSGAASFATTVQSAPNSAAGIFQGSTNTATISQSGIGFHDADVFQNLSDSAVGTISEGNIAAVGQFGADNDAFVRQAIDNVASVNQRGFGNVAQVRQDALNPTSAVGNDASVHQSGINGSVVITQYAVNQANVTQLGDGTVSDPNVVLVSQFGDAVGDIDVVTALQTVGFGNQIEVTQHDDNQISVVDVTQNGSLHTTIVEQGGTAFEDGEPSIPDGVFP